MHFEWNDFAIFKIDLFSAGLTVLIDYCFVSLINFSSSQKLNRKYDL